MVLFLGSNKNSSQPCPASFLINPLCAKSRSQLRICELEHSVNDHEPKLSNHMLAILANTGSFGPDFLGRLVNQFCPVESLGIFRQGF